VKEPSCPICTIEGESFFTFSLGVDNPLWMGSLEKNFRKALVVDMIFVQVVEGMASKCNNEEWGVY
jgi:hypothetical protein